MSIYKDLGFTYARNAGEDLSGKLYYLAHVDTDGDIVVAGDGEHICGVITEENVADKPCTVQFGGIAKVIAGGVIAAGAPVASDTNGKATSSTSAGDYMVGIALEAAAAANDIIPVMLTNGRIHA